MNLGKLFNFKYLKQNIKKSKGLLTVLVFIIPVITALVLIGKNSSEYVSSTDTGVVALANIFGMYVIPVIISFLLYGYVYKKNSVDFVNSMPLTRTTIFTTNFIGGIAMIAVIQMITAIVTVISAMVLSNIYIATGMILDIFIVMFLAYSFVFAATSLAMTVSGNFLTQIVVTLLIVFLIPFISIFGVADIDKTLDLELGNRIVTISQNVENQYTLPSMLMGDIIGIGETKFFSDIRNVKTIFLVVLYFGIGLYLFNKRKMENVEISFSKIWVHLIVKGITLVPMVFILELLAIRGVFYGIAIALIFIYYCLYDFITNKKVSIKFTIPAFIVSFVLLIGLYKGINFAGMKMLQESISIDDIEEVSIEALDYSRYSSMLNTYGKGGDLNIYIQDRDLIKKICNALIDEKHRKYTDYHYPNASNMVYLDFKLANGKEKHSVAGIDYDVYLEAIDYVMSNQQNLEKYTEYYEIGKGGYIIANEKFVSEEDTATLISLYNQIPSEKRLEVERNFSIGGQPRNYIPQPNFTVFFYKNHELVQITLNPFMSQEIFSKMNEIAQNQVKDDFANRENVEDNYLYIYITDRRVKQYEDETFEYTYMKNNVNILNYITQHLNDTIDMNDNFYVVNMNGLRADYTAFYLKETDELNYIIEMDKEYEGEEIIPYEDDFVEVFE